MPGDIVARSRTTILDKDEESAEDARGKISGGAQPMFVGINGDEGPVGNSLLIAGRPGIVLGIRLKLFHKTEDGP